MKESICRICYETSCSVLAAERAGRQPEQSEMARCNRDGHFLRRRAIRIMDVASALRSAAEWREGRGDIAEPKALRIFANLIDPNSEDYSPGLDPLSGRAFDLGYPPAE